jgi:ATP-dependent DNA ligase
MEKWRWSEPFIVVRIEFLEWTPENRLRHPRFAGFAPTRMLAKLWSARSLGTAVGATRSKNRRSAL